MTDSDQFEGVLARQSQRARVSLGTPNQFPQGVQLILAESQGGLGNQLFQYAAVRAAATRRETLVFIGFHDLQRFIKPSRLGRSVFVSKAMFRALKLRMPWLVSALSRLVGSVTLGKDGRSFRRTRGGWLSLYLFAAGYCQDEKLVSTEVVSRLFSRNRRSPTTPLGNAGTTNAHPMRCFVHVRRGDYLTWPSPSKPAALPAHWFSLQMERLRALHPGVQFIFFSDDPHWVRSSLPQSSNSEVFDGDADQSLREMASCDAGIISPSTFGWWACVLARSVGASGPFIAPLHWVGWREKAWYPENIRTEFLEYFAVDEDAEQ